MATMRGNVVRQAFTVDVFSPPTHPFMENGDEYAAAYRLRAC